jgi:hypothetical protein
LAIVDVRLVRLRMEFFDIGAAVYFLRKVIWTVPSFTVERYRPQLEAFTRAFEPKGRSSRTRDTGPHRGPEAD